MNTTQEVNPAPAAMGPREEKSYSLVIISGLLTTALALFGVYLLDTRTEDFHIMGWYANYVIPVGAILVGVVASSGYGLASWFSGVKITRALLWTVLVLQLAAYFAAKYIEFTSLNPNGQPARFFEYFDQTTRSFAWKQKDGSMGQPLGAWGYAIRGLEILGFAAGGLIVPVLLRKAPYCQACQRYMRTQQLGLVPASVPVKKVKKSDTDALAAYQAEQEQAFAGAKQAWEKLSQLATSNQAPEFRKALAELEPGKKQAAKLPQRLSLHLVSCARCQSGWLKATLLVGQGQNIKQSEFARADLHPEFVREVRFAGAAARV